MHRYPDSPVFYRNLARDFPLAVRGEGCWIEDEAGKRYLDAVGGAFVACIGHGVREIGEAMARQAGRIAYVSGAAFTNEGVEALAAKLVARTPGMDRAYILGSGSEATEAALKLARQHWVERGQPTKHRVIALKPEWYDVLVTYVTRERVAAHFAGQITGAVERFELPNLRALNFLLHGALDGGGTLSLKTDAQGKVYSTALLRMVFDVPDAEAKKAGLDVA